MKSLTTIFFLAVMTFTLSFSVSIETREFSITNQAEARCCKKIGKAFKKVGKAIGNGAKAVGKVAKKAAPWVLGGVVGGLIFTGIKKGQEGKRVDEIIASGDCSNVDSKISQVEKYTRGLRFNKRKWNARVDKLKALKASCGGRDIAEEKDPVPAICKKHLDGLLNLRFSAETLGCKHKVNVTQWKFDIMRNCTAAQADPNYISDEVAMVKEDLSVCTKNAKNNSQFGIRRNTTRAYAKEVVSKRGALTCPQYAERSIAMTQDFKDSNCRSNNPKMVWNADQLISFCEKTNSNVIDGDLERREKELDRCRKRTNRRSR